MPRISHVSAVRNEERFINSMIESWLREADDRSAELIIVDDHSDDDTFEIVVQWAERDVRIRPFSGRAAGLRHGKVAAFNYGIQVSRGDFVGLIAGDDLVAPGAYQSWEGALDSFGGEDLVVAFGRLRTVSADAKADGIVIPRRAVGNRSGGTSMFSRAIAAEVFPIPEELASEDTWTAYLLPALANHVVEMADIVLLYRIHSGNSNPRDREFDDMSAWMNSRSKAYSLMLDSPQLKLSPDQRNELAGLLELEALRFAGDLSGVLSHRRSGMKERLRAASMARPSLWRYRRLLFRYLSGW